MASLVTAGLMLAVSAPAAITITDPGQGVYDFTAAAAELSGLSRLDGDVYYAISDDANQRKVHQLNITVNPATGFITAAAVTATNTLAAGYDLEGIAYCPPRGTWFVSDEGQHPDGGHIREHTLPDGNLVGVVTIPPPLLNDRANFGLESCAWGAGALWTANEEALAHESALSTATTGSLVRLQKFDHALQPAGQWAYQTDSYGEDSSLTTAERSGVSDLLALPDGNLLVLERALGFGFIPSYRNRIYLVDFSGATDVSGIADLDGATFTPVTKTLLWDKNLGSISTRNFEGIALGPALPMIGPASHSVLLIADNGGGTQQHLHALVVHGVELPAQPLARWRLAHWGTTNNLGPAANDADPDGDGLRNLLEYALGRSPAAADTTAAFSAVLTGDAAGLLFTLTTNAPDVTVQAEQNHAGLHTNAWTTAGIAETRLTNGAFIEVQAWVQDPPPATLTNLFLRLRASEP
jgi:hypothetical protein